MDEAAGKGAPVHGEVVGEPWMWEVTEGEGGAPWSSRVTAHNRVEGSVGEDSETCGFRVRNDSPELGRLLGGWVGGGPGP